MNMIGHANERFGFNTSVIPGNFIPYGLKHFSCITGHHHAILDVTEQA